MNGKKENPRLQPAASESTIDGTIHEKHARTLIVKPVAMVEPEASPNGQAYFIFFIQPRGPNKPRMATGGVSRCCSASALFRWCWSKGVCITRDEAKRIFGEVYPTLSTLHRISTREVAETFLHRAQAVCQKSGASNADIR